MAVEVYMGSKFGTPYERKALSIIVTDLEAIFGNTGDLCIILANYFIQGHQVDVTILKRDSIAIVELKDCSLPFMASENGIWLCPNGHIVGQKDNNPFQQVYSYRVKWKEFLGDNKDKFNCLRTIIDHKALWQMRGVVAISPSLHPEVKVDIPNSNKTWWFDLVGSDKVGEYVSFQTNKHLNFSDNELRTMPALLSIPRVPLGSIIRNHGPRPRSPWWIIAIVGVFLVAGIMMALFMSGSRNATLAGGATSIPPSTPFMTTPIPSAVSAESSPDPSVAPAGSNSQPVFHGTGRDTTVEPSWYPCQEKQIKGNKNSNIYHVPTGDFYAKTFQEVTCFDTTAEAEAAGFRAARN